MASSNFFISFLWSNNFLLLVSSWLKILPSLNGMTLVPLKLYFKNNKLKVLLGVCRGKKNYDKRESIKERDIKRETLKNLKRY